MESNTLVSKQGQRFLLALLLIMGLSIRLFQLNQAPLDFHPTRQYRFLLITRDYYWADKEDLNTQQKKVWQANNQIINKLEPPVLEYISAQAFKWLGEEHIWLPRLLNVLLWVLSANFLFFAARHFTGFGPSLWATGIYLFLPYGIQASRALMPEALMMNLLTLSILMILQYFKRPTVARLLLAGIVSSLCVLFKTGFCLFVLFSVFSGLWYYRKKEGEKASFPSLISFGLIISLPAIVYVLMVIKDESTGRFFLHLLFTLEFWKELYTMLSHLYYYPFVIIPACYLSLYYYRGQQIFYMLFAALIGFLIFSALFTYHIQTHNYYHLQFLPFVALMLMPFGLFTNKLELQGFIWLILMATFASGSQSIKSSNTLDRSIIVSKKENIHSNHQTEINNYKKIGELCKHSHRIINLSTAYGAPLYYHGQVAGRPWNKVADIKIIKMKGQNYHYSINDQIKLYDDIQPEYFVITDFRAYKKMPNLNSWLQKHLTFVAKNEHFEIYQFKNEGSPSK